MREQLRMTLPASRPNQFHEISHKGNKLMKLQYLGDSRDAFKWDYLDFLAKHTESPELVIIPMLTPSDESGQGGDPPNNFSSSPEIQRFCRDLQEDRKLKQLCNLPEYTSGKYKVRLHRDSAIFVDEQREQYFSDIKSAGKDVLFLDPDVGFMPSVASDQHVEYSDIRNIHDNMDESAVIVVFQYFPRIRFCQNYEEISNRLDNKIKCHKTALFWNGRVMFVIIGKTKEQINQVHKINESYQKLPRPVEVIRGDAG